jgi:inhibitor of KinA sporulation pathway (predicted exonuclease)
VFHKYVLPRFNPGLTAFCTELTGITQSMVKNEKSLEETLEDFDKWIRALPTINEENSAFVTCGDWDLSTCLRAEAETKGIELKGYLKRYINIKKYFAKLLRTDRLMDLMDMLKTLGVKHEGKHHSGIDDVANISNICIELISKHGATFPRTEVVRLLK